MKAFQLIIAGNWAHFKKPETNNNPLTHDFITKTAFVGLIGAVLGIEREKMRPLFPILCEDLCYGVQILQPVKKETWGFTMRKAVNLLEKAPKHLELLKNPKYKISLALHSERSEGIFVQFLESIKSKHADFTPVLGLHNCPADLSFISKGSFSEKQSGSFAAKCFVTRKHSLVLRESPQFRIGLDKIPTFQNDDFWNLPDKYIEVIYPEVSRPSEDQKINVTGDFYEYDDGEPWCLI